MVKLTKLVSRLTPALKVMLENAVGEAINRKVVAVEIPHWLYHVIFSSDTELQDFLESQGVQLNQLQAELEQRMPIGMGEEGKQPTISGSLAKLVERAWLIASVDLEHAAILPEVLLLALQTSGSLGTRLEALQALEPVSTDALRSFAVKRGQNLNFAAGGSSSKGGGVSSGGGDALSRFTANLTQEAREGRLDPVLGRTDEIANAIDVLLRKRQNNPILLGEAGVGKTAVVEGLAQKIAAGEVPDQLKNAELINLDLGLLQAGASVKGEFEERLKNIIKEVQSASHPIIVFIDEAHTIIGAGGTEGQNDAANLLKPALARGQFRVIAATTFAEYKKYIEKDPAFSRRFQSISVDEPNREAAVNILRSVSEELCKHHGVPIRGSALQAAVDLSIRYLPSRRLPDKAISLLDTACARVALSQHTAPKQIAVLEEKLHFTRAEHKLLEEEVRLYGSDASPESDLVEAIEAQEHELKDQVATWQAQKSKVFSYLNATSEAQDAAEASVSIPFDITVNGDEELYVHPWVSDITIASVISDWTGIPVSNLNSDDAECLLQLEDRLKRRVMGQDAAIEAIAKSLKVSRAGLTDHRKPIGVFMMCGPSGVGKTETALAIAEEFFDGENSLTTINMSEFKEPHKASMLLGASAGYVGYGKGGILTEAIRKRPYQVLLLDEMEKAHREIQDIFFQIFDRGYITDSEGTKVDFRNTIIIMTSNTGGEKLRQLTDSCDGVFDPVQAKEALQPLLLDYFSPAFIGRTELIAYQPLDETTCIKIAEIHLARIKERVRSQYNAELSWKDSFVDYVQKRNDEPMSGGRAIEAIINRDFLPKLAEECIKRVIDDAPLSSICVTHDGTDISLIIE
ncbi:ClpV1 family T6SS ATPase [Pseudovibrio japonicus]|uniref:ClpV1 family T6SS ATPase n=1 Tax=Pseudovibrio japonicus TaxID=366534 RepID=A0ABQ3ETK2_9HYPH|nr:type VI secretion system ATPase TssH [Pseudovibrio japonicus]GHB50161.1 ClpV1 family T6SS ATPase [Pseudovibrio japonicus]